MNDGTFLKQFHSMMPVEHVSQEITRLASEMVGHQGGTVDLSTGMANFNRVEIPA